MAVAWRAIRVALSCAAVKNRDPGKAVTQKRGLPSTPRAPWPFQMERLSSDLSYEKGTFRSHVKVERVLHRVFLGMVQRHTSEVTLVRKLDGPSSG